MNVLAAIDLFKLVDIFASMISKPDKSNVSASFKNKPSKLLVLIKISIKFPKRLLHPTIKSSFLSFIIISLCHLSLSELFFVK